MKEFTKEEIKEIFKNLNSSSKKIREFKINNKLKEFCEFKVKESNGFFKTVFDYVYFIVNDLEFKKCSICGKQLSFNQLKRNSSVCSIKCSRYTEHFINSRRMTCISKYGCENSSQSQYVKEKFKNTCIERYGASSPLSNSSSVKYKINEHWAKLGVDNPGQLQEIKDKIKKTNLEKYGNEVYLKSDDFYKRSEETCLKHFGVKHHLLSNEIQDKIKKTMMKKYGVENAYNMEKNKLAQKYVKNHESFLNLERFKDYVVPMFSEDEWEGIKSEKEYEWKCIKCGKIFKQRMYKTSFNEEKYMPRCLNCFPKINGFSYAELELLDFCRQYFPNANKDRQLIKPYELDILIPEIKLAIEFNGIFYHSIERSGCGYHLNKTGLCNEKGYRLIHIWEDEWNKNPEEIKRKLIDIFEGHENLKFENDEIRLDRSWYNNVEIPEYELVEESSAELVDRCGFNVENCGCLIFKKKFV